MDFKPAFILVEGGSTESMLLSVYNLKCCFFFFFSLCYVVVMIGGELHVGFGSKAGTKSRSAPEVSPALSFQRSTLIFGRPPVY